MNKLTKYFVFITLIILTITMLSVNSFSLWSDECTTAYLVKSNNLNDLIYKLKHLNGSESQMPGWVIGVFLWSKIVGYSEYGLRSFNILLSFTLLVYSYFFIIRNKIIQLKTKYILITTIVIMFLNSFATYNLNEARCNFLLLTLGFVVLSSTIIFGQSKETKYLIVISSAYVAGFFANMLFSIIIIPVIILLVNEKINLFAIIKSHKIILLTTLFACFLIGLYYITTLVGGKGGAKETPSFLNLGYLVYEFLGFSGLGPSKEVIRLSNNPVFEFRAFVIPLVLMILGYVIIFLSFIKSCKYKMLLKQILVLIISVIAFFTIAYIAHFRFWGRHAIFLYPLWCLIVSYMICELYISLGKRSILLILPLLIMQLLSMYNMNFDEKYQKTDIRGAFAVVEKLNKGKYQVLNVETPYSLDYYKLSNSTCNLADISIKPFYMIWFKRMSKIPEIEKEKESVLLKNKLKILISNNNYIVYLIE